MLDKINAYAMTYHDPVQFPLTISGEKINWGCGVFDLAPDGMNYLIQRLNPYIDNTQARELYAENVSEFVNYINKCRAKQLKNEKWRAEKSGWILSVDNAGLIYGILTTYNPKSNLEVIKLIESYGLLDRIKKWRITKKEFNVFFEQKKTATGFGFGLNVRNGESGHATFSYRLYVSKGDYEFSVPYYTYRRHMGQLFKAEENILQVLETIKSITVMETIVTSTSTMAYALLHKDSRYEKLYPYIYENGSLENMLIDLHELSEVRGFKTVSKKALNLIYEELLNVVTN